MATLKKVDISADELSRLPFRRQVEFIRKRAEDYFAKKNIPERERQAQIDVMVARFSKKLADNRARDIADLQAAEERGRSDGGSWRSVLGMTTSAALGFADATTFGHLPRAVGFLGGRGEVGEEMARRGLEAAQATDPGSYGAGQVAGLLNPRGAGGAMVAGARGAVAGGNMLLRGGTRAARAAGAASAAGRVEAGLSRLASPQANFGSKAITQVTKNLIGSAGALGTYNLLEAQDPASDAYRRIMQGDESAVFDIPAQNSAMGALSDKVENALDETLSQWGSPLNLALSGGIGLATAKMTGVANPIFTRTAREIEASTGVRMPLDVITGSGGIRKFVSFLARTPGTQGRMEKVRSAVLSAVHQHVNALGKGVATAARGTPVERVASGVVSASGRITRRRQRQQKIALDAEGPNRATLNQSRGFLAGVEAILKDNPGKELKDLGGLIRNIKRRMGTRDNPRRPTLHELEGLRKEINVVRQFDQSGAPVSEISKRMAGDIYHVLTETLIPGVGPKYAQAQKAAQLWHRIDEVLPSSKQLKNAVPDVVLKELFNSRKFFSRRVAGEPTIGRWKAWKEGATPDELAASRGWYLGKVMERIALSEDGMFSLDRLRKSTGANDMFNKKIMREVLGGDLVESLFRHVKLNDSMRRGGILAAEGSPTYGRSYAAAAVTSSIVFFQQLIANTLAGNPMSTLANMSAAPAVLFAMQKFGASATTGPLSRKLGVIAELGPAPLSRGAVVAQGQAPESIPRQALGTGIPGGGTPIRP